MLPASGFTSFLLPGQISQGKRREEPRHGVMIAVRSEIPRKLISPNQSEDSLSSNSDSPHRKLARGRPDHGAGG